MLLCSSSSSVSSIQTIKSFFSASLEFLGFARYSGMGSDYVRRNDRLSMIPHCCTNSRGLTHEHKNTTSVSPCAATTSLNLILSLVWTLLWSNNKTHGNIWWLTACLSPARPAAHAAGCGAAGLDGNQRVRGSVHRDLEPDLAPDKRLPSGSSRSREGLCSPLVTSHRPDDFTATLVELVEEAGRERTQPSSGWRSLLTAKCQSRVCVRACVYVCVCACVEDLLDINMLGHCGHCI